MNLTLAKTLSYLLHPLLMPTFLIGFLYLLSPDPLLLRSVPPDIFLFLLGFIFLYTAALPSMVVFYMYRKKIITDLHLSLLKDRKWPFLITVLLYMALFYFLYSKGGILVPVAYLLFGMVLVIALTGIISLKWQISAHMAGIGGVIGTFAVLFVKYGEYRLFLPILILLIISGLLGSARLRQNAHTFSQTGAGFLLGLFISYAGAWYFI